VSDALRACFVAGIARTPFGRFGGALAGLSGPALGARVIATAGGAEKAYCAEGVNHFTIRELLTPLEQTADLCGLRFLAPFALFGARTAVEEGRVAAHVEDWSRVLEALRDGRVDLEAYAWRPRLSRDAGAKRTTRGERPRRGATR